MKLLDRQRYIGLARVLADTAGLSVVFTPGETQPRTDGKRLYVAAPDEAWDDTMWNQWYYELMHEIGHQREPWYEWKDVMKEKGITRVNILGPLNNLNSDHAQERGHYGLFKGVDIILGEGRRNFILKNTEFKAAEDDEQAAWYACWKYDTLMRGKWNPSMDGVHSQLKLDTPSERLFDKLMAWGKSAATCNNEWEVYEYTKEMLDVLGLDAEELEKESQDAANNSEGDGSAGEGGSEEGPEVESTGEDGEAGDEVEARSESRKAFYDPFLKHDHALDDYTSTRDSDIDYSDAPYLEGSISVRDVATFDFKRGIFPRTLKDTREFDGMKASSGFANRVRRLLQVRSQARWEGGKRRGRVHPRALWKTSANDDHVFRTKVENVNLKDVAVTVMVDFSGSMGGERINHATKAALMLNQAITRLGVKVAITGFTDAHADSIQPCDLLIQQHGERISDDEMLRRFGMCASLMQQNADGESLLSAYNIIMRRPEKRKVIVVLSDGQPCSWNPGDDRWLLRKVVSEVEQSGVALYAIGIQSGAVNNYYKNRCVISDVDELEDKLLEVVKTQIIGG